MFSNRLSLSHVAALSFFLAFACSRQNEDSENGGGGGNLSTTTSVIGAGSTNGTGTLGGGNNSSTDPNLVGKVVPLTSDQVTAIGTSACNGWADEPESVPGKLQLVVDVSSSMGSTANGTGNSSKWVVTRDALVEAICGVTGPGLGAGMAVGLMFYPNMVNENISRTPVAESVCLNLDGITPMDVMGDNGANTHRTLLRQRLTQAVLGRGTPTAGAYKYALENIALSPAQLAFPGDTYMLLITDGMPTLYYGCYNPAGQLQNLPGDEVVALVDGAFGRGVKTFIIGSPGSEDGRAWLSQAAFLGGTGKPGCDPSKGGICHMDMTTAADFSVALREGLQQVVSTVSNCKYTIPTQSSDGLYTVDPNKINPIITFGDGSTELVTRDNKNGANCTEGFYLIDSGQMQLCPGTCGRFQADSHATLKLYFGCASDDIINVIQ
jgi:hypothetical protein